MIFFFLMVKRPHGSPIQMPQPPPALQLGGPPPELPADDDGPAAKVEMSRSVSLLPQSGQSIESEDAETD